MRFRDSLILAMLFLALPEVAYAQLRPWDYFNREVLLYQPVIGVVPSGIDWDVYPVVSADRRYVTVSTTPRLTQLVRLEDFPVFGIGGFVGGFAPPGAGPPVRRGGLLDTSGMTRLSP